MTTRTLITDSDRVYGIFTPAELLRPNAGPGRRPHASTPGEAPDAVDAIAAWRSHAHHRARDATQANQGRGPGRPVAWVLGGDVHGIPFSCVRSCPLLAAADVLHNVRHFTPRKPHAS